MLYVVNYRIGDFCHMEILAAVFAVLGGCGAELFHKGKLERPQRAITDAYRNMTDRYAG